MIAPKNSHSSLVSLELFAAGLRIPLSQVAHDFAIPVEAVDVPACEGEVLMTVDGVQTVMLVALREGGQATQRRIKLSNPN